jgi:hypothetical protein
MVVFVYVLICAFMIEKKMVKLWWRVELRCCLLLFPFFGFGFWLCVVDDEWIGEG